MSTITNTTIAQIPQSPVVQTKQAKSAIVYEVAYTSAEGEYRCVEVDSLDLARSLARELTHATGHRAIIFKRRREWKVYLADLVEGTCEVLWSGMTKQEVMMRMRLWKERKTECVLLAWPDWAKIAATVTEKLP